MLSSGKDIFNNDFSPLEIDYQGFITCGSIQLNSQRPAMLNVNTNSIPKILITGAGDEVNPSSSDTLLLIPPTIKKSEIPPNGMNEIRQSQIESQVSPARTSCCSKVCMSSS